MTLPSVEGQVFVAAVAAMLATALAVPTPPPTGVGEARRRWRWGIGPVAGAVGAGLLLAVTSPRVATLLLLAAATVAGGGLLWRGRRRRREAVLVAARVLETCDLLAAELSAGQPPGAALDRAALSWPTLGPVAEAFRVGSEVPTALRELAAGPGARDLRLVAAAWQVAHRTGQGLAEAVERVADGLRSDQASRHVVEGELASARATARMVAGLPVLALTMGSGAGGDPWGFLLGRPAGLACLAGGIGFALVGLWWIEAIARGVDRSS
ncbi:MAG TPA: type II secretion system F family protein [Nocardioides sp.]|nr:type II secretion system F family protein [Nocardioides sp.]